LIKEGNAPIATFRCQSDGGLSQARETLVSATGTVKKYGWTARTQFSYGIQWPYDGYGTTTITTTNFARPTDTNGCSGIVLFADRSPSPSPNLGSVGSTPSGATTINTPANHTADGEVLMHRDYSISFYKSLTDSKAGFQGDDIYMVKDNGMATNVPGAFSPSTQPPTTTTDTWILPFRSR
jgi:hypothetical protein